jgi:exosome complex component RRP42
MDGRARLETRPYTLEVNVVPTASGSARLRIETANILAVVKLDVGTLKPTDTNSSLIRTSVDVKTPGIERSVLNPLVISLATEIKSFILQTQLLQNDHLIIIPGKQAWFLSIDIMVFGSCGNIFDQALIATRAALATATIPALKVYRKIDPQTQKVLDYTLELMPGSVVPVGIWDKHFPLSLSLCILNDVIVIDPTDKEEACIGSRYLVGFDRDGNLIGHTKVGVTGVSVQLFQESLEIAQQIGAIAYRYYLQALSDAIEKDQKMAVIVKKLCQKLGKNSPLPEGFNFDPEKAFKDNKIDSKTLGGSIFDGDEGNQEGYNDDYILAQLEKKNNKTQNDDNDSGSESD